MDGQAERGRPPGEGLDRAASPWCRGQIAGGPAESPRARRIVAAWLVAGSVMAVVSAGSCDSWWWNAKNRSRKNRARRPSAAQRIVRGRPHAHGLGQHVEEGRPEHAARGEAQIDLEPGVSQDRRQGEHPSQQADGDDQRTIEGRGRMTWRSCSPSSRIRPLFARVEARIMRSSGTPGLARDSATRPDPLDTIRLAAQASREGKTMSKLSEAEILEKLPAAKGWERHGDMLVRTWQFPSFRRAIEFVNQVAATDREVRPLSRHPRQLPECSDRDVHPRRRRPDRTRFRPDLRRSMRYPPIARGASAPPPRSDRRNEKNPGQPAGDCYRGG